MSIITDFFLGLTTMSVVGGVTYYLIRKRIKSDEKKIQEDIAKGNITIIPDTKNQYYTRMSVDQNNQKEVKHETNQRGEESRNDSIGGASSLIPSQTGTGTPTPIIEQRSTIQTSSTSIPIKSESDSPSTESNPRRKVKFD